MEQSPNINMHGLQNIVNQIVASNLTGVMLSRIDTYKAEEPNKEGSSQGAQLEVYTLPSLLDAIQQR